MSNADKDAGLDRAIRPPFRILPARGRDFTVEILLVAGGLCAAAVGMVLLVDGNSYVGAAFLAVLGGLVALFVGCSRAIREYRYFDPRNEYALIVELDEFKVVTPDGTHATSWSDLVPFEFEKAKTVTEHKGHEHVRVTYKSVARVGGVDIEIPLRDFAILFGLDDEERAIGITKALNQVRDLMRTRQDGEAAPLFDPPLGLVVGPMLPLRKAQPIKVKSVVQRQ